MGVPRPPSLLITSLRGGGYYSLPLLKFLVLKQFQTCFSNHVLLLPSGIIKEYLIRWKDLPIADATWEQEHMVREAGLELLEDKKFQAGETVISPTS